MVESFKIKSLNIFVENMVSNTTFQLLELYNKMEWLKEKINHLRNFLEPC